MLGGAILELTRVRWLLVRQSRSARGLESPPLRPEAATNNDSREHAMASAPEHVIELIFGRWRSQILYAGAALGVFDHLAENRATGAPALAAEIGTDPALLYRLLRAIAAIGLLAEDDSKGFRLNEAGALLREDHLHSLKAIALLEEGPEHYAAWKHLVPIVRDGKQDGFLREFGAPLFDYGRANPHYSAVFNRAMTSYSAVETQWALAALASEDFSQIRTLCDVGGGHGHLACGLLSAYPQRHVPRSAAGRRLYSEIGPAQLERR
jgi:hypothetical protein